MKKQKTNYDFLLNFKIGTTNSVLYPFSCHHTFLVVVFYFHHFGHKIGKVDHLLGGIPPGDNNLGRFWFLLKYSYQFLGGVEIVKDGNIGLIQYNQIKYIRANDFKKLI